MHFTRICALLAAANLAPLALAAGITHTVPAGGPIQPVIDAAGPGDTVVVPKGVYFETLLIGEEKEGLILQGKKAVLDCLPGDSPAGTGITILSNGVTVKGFTIRFATGSEAPPEGHDGLGSGIQAVAGELTVQDCTVSYAAGNGISITGDLARVERCVIRSVGRAAIEILGGAAVVSKVTTAGTRMGIHVEGPSALVEKVKMADHASVGIDVIGVGGRVLKSKVERGQSRCDADNQAIRVAGDGAVVSGNKVSDSADDAAIEVSGAGAIVEKNKLDDVGKLGIVLAGEAGLITKNKLKGADVAGTVVDVTGNACRLVSNSISKAHGIGIELDGSDGVLEKNKLKDVGSFFAGGLVVTGDRNRLTKNAVNATLGYGARILGADNVLDTLLVKKATSNGIVILGGSTGTTLFKCKLTVEGEGIQNYGVGTSLEANKVKGARQPLTSATTDGATVVDLGGNSFSVPAGPGDIPEPAVP